MRSLIEELTGKTPPESTVYDALKRLERLGLVEGYWAKSPGGTIRKYYRARENAANVLEKVLRELCPLIASSLCNHLAKTKDNSLVHQSA